MPYRRSRKRPARRASAKKRGGARPRYARKKPAFKRRNALTNKKILNLTSTKKRNGMLTFSNTNTVGAASNVLQQNLTINAPNGANVLWSPTAQDLSDQTGNPASISEVAARTSSVCFMRGLSERIRIQTSSGVPWFWRRICFTSKGGSFNSPSSSDTPLQGTQPYLDTSSGVQRYALNQQVNNMPNTINNQQSIIFKGASGVDWNDVIIAPIDTSRITLKYDRVTTFRSGNNNGTVRETNLWHGMNKNLRYDDDESGDREVTSFFSTDSKEGMGDYYIYDIIRAGLGGTTSDLMSMAFNSTLYWHEK